MWLAHSNLLSSQPGVLPGRPPLTCPVSITLAPVIRHDIVVVRDLAKSWRHFLTHQISPAPGEGGQCERVRHGRAAQTLR